jgi:hypothetical protein
MASFASEVADTITDLGLRRLRDAIAALARLDQD